MKQVMRFHQQEEKNDKHKCQQQQKSSDTKTERQAADDILFSLQPKRR